MLLHDLHQRLIDCSTQDRHEQGSTSMNSENYKYFKTMPNVERYISFNLPFDIEKSVVNTEMGRHARIPRQYRSCFNVF